MNNNKRKAVVGPQKQVEQEDDCKTKVMISKSNEQETKQLCSVLRPISLNKLNFEHTGKKH